MAGELAWDPKSIKVNKEGYVDTANNTQTFYRVWGEGDIPCLFFHGGPGQCVADYNDSNFYILNPAHYTVIEVDQLGTGKSKPSLRDSLMPASELYQNTTARDVVDALVAVVKHLGYEKVYLHGGSWGSTMALLFAEWYPEMTLGMVVRGIFLGTKEELDVTFDQSVANATENITNSFKKFIGFAKERGFEGNPNCSKDVVKFYLDLFTSGTSEERDVAAWNWWVHELWAMDELEHQYNEVGEKDIAEARSVAFWEASLFYSLAFGDENAYWDIIGNINKIPKVPIHIVHGTGDFLCPIEFAKKLENSFINNNFEIKCDYVDSGHKVANLPIREAVRKAVEEFATLMREQKE
eukprot:CAMPEP_0201520672 /NCGR_PEP_ID=MMETSP0161_2-20130828/12029_1 /ASSEMBLY_ACC=CAM_ASM_000251 /TAXON_ID=180227 /ORGANISM="Neoparamoeba aestuarina, Strain SoJaBio B1-5/56/2" /LENGTH=351 /DNA_ID=CAMNT_0047919133 /DNA_START=98 /DNA_END=1153 /DNA_ORIENTATION=-